MATLKQKAELLIEVKGDDQISQILSDVDDKAKKIGATTKKTAKETTKLSRAWSGTATGINSALEVAGKMVATVKAAGDVYRDVGVSMAREAHFSRVFEDAGEALHRFKAAVADRIDTTTLQGIATMARTAGLSLDQTAQVLNVSVKIAQARGMESVTMAEQMVKALAAGTDESVKQVGLHLDLERAFAAETKAQGHMLSIQEKRSIMLIRLAEATKAEFGDIEIGESVLGNAERFAAAWANATDTMKRELLPLLDRVRVTVQAMTTGASTQLGDLDAMQAKVLRLYLRQFAATRGIAFNIGGMTASFGQMMELGSSVPAKQMAAILRTYTMEAEGAGLSARRLSSHMAILAAVADRQAQPALAEQLRLLTETGRAASSSANAAAEVAKADEAAAKAGTERNRTIKEQVEKLEAARLASMRNAAAMAEVAHRMGLSTIATEKWTEAAKLAEQGENGLAAAVAFTAKAIHAQNEEMITSLRLRAEIAAMFAEFGATAAEKPMAEAEASALKSQLQQVIAASQRGVLPSFAPSAPKPKGRRGGGGGGKRGEEWDEERADWEFALQDLEREQEESKQATADLLGKKAAEMEIIAQADKTLAEAHAANILQLRDQGMAALSDSASFLMEFGGEIENVFAQQVANGIGVAVGEFAKMDSMIRDLTKAGDTLAGSMKKNAPAMISSSGKVTAAFIKDKTAQAAVMAVFEAAAAAASYPDVLGMVTHGLAAVMYAVVAGMSAGGGGGGGGGKSAPRAPAIGRDLPVAADRDEGRSMTVVINMGGATVIGGNRREVGRDLAEALAEAVNQRSSTNPDFVPG